MPRGRKLDLAIGASFDEGWQQVEEVRETPKEELRERAAHRLVFKKEKRRGKIVTLSGPFFLGKQEALELLAALKRTMGCGGTYKEGWMEFQGDVQATLRLQLKQAGFSLK